MIKNYLVSNGCLEAIEIICAGNGVLYYNSTYVIPGGWEGRREEMLSL